VKPLLTTLGAFIAIILFVVLSSAVYTVNEGEQVVITQFGKPVGEPIVQAGLRFKTPFIQTVNRFEKRILEWDGPSSKMPTRDKVYIVVDTFGRWRIKDPLAFFQQLRDERSALSRLDDILGSETRNVIARHDFIEAVRSTKDRKPMVDEQSLPDGRLTPMPTIIKGRALLEREVFASAAPKVASFGIELLDVRFKRINYNETVSDTIYSRMVSEREQIAERFRSEGAGEAAKIDGNRERDLFQIESEAYKKIQEIEGTADAKAIEIYAKAYDQTPVSRELFEFLKTMESYKTILSGDTNLILTTNSDLLRYLKSSTPAPASAAPGLPGLPANIPSFLNSPTR
jgi:membrane protease subunit HflC